MADTICMPHAGKGRALVDLLTAYLGIPKGCVGFDIHFEAGEPIRVTVRTYARDDGRSIDGSLLDVVSTNFKLVEAEGGDC
ncbi:hypothetical protein [Burkholderia anthina]|uniref:hypothetical protein n=1 Tax=Burkholderia anthina TaxID=179879 RepID=UPI001AA06680|nr:hypothetical protein [Burkholderia anthina]QTD91762.1 hypothetical protein J4G50_26265 [Burkholderia anthina]